MYADAQEHQHKDRKGILHTCYHKCRSALLDWGFWVGLTVGFPIEHFLYEKVWPFNLLKDWMGL